MNILQQLKAYYRLTKPGIVYGNLLTTIGGFIFGAQRHIVPWLLLTTATGTALIIASACVWNNYIDRDIDAGMDRTRKRPLVTHVIKPRQALAYGALLCIAGFVILLLYTNMPTVALGALGFISYVFWYTPSKRQTVHSTLIGSISGATPVAAGYTAAHGSFTVGAFLLFMIMVAWQMPHFYAIAIFRRDDYAAVNVPVLSVARGITAARQQSIYYIALFVIAVAALPLLGYASFTFFVVMVGVAIYWLFEALRREPSNDARWARGIFGWSLTILLIFSAMLAANPWLP